MQKFPPIALKGGTMGTLCDLNCVVVIIALGERSGDGAFGVAKERRKPSLVFVRKNLLFLWSKITL